MAAFIASRRPLVARVGMLLAFAVFWLGVPYFYDETLALDSANVGQPSVTTPPEAASTHASNESTFLWDNPERKRGRVEAALLGMEEPFLSCCTPGIDEAYRFTWLRSFRPNVAVRFWQQGDSHYLHVTTQEKAGSGWQHFEVPLRPSSGPVQELSAGEWTAVRQAVDRSGLWHEPRLGRVEGIDTSTWILEGRRDSHYELAVEVSPEGGPFRETCLTLLRLAGFAARDEEI